MDKLYAAALGLSLDQLHDIGKIRSAYKFQLSQVLRKRDLRIKLNRAYSEVCAKHFNSSLSVLEVMIIENNMQGLQKTLSKDKKLLNAKVNQYPIIYLAVRSGHYEVTQFLLRSGCSLDFKDCISTPMHCAAYYGHVNIIPLLLMYGVPIDIRNSFGSLPIEQAATPQIQKLLTIVKGSRIQNLNEGLIKSEIAHSFINIKDQKNQIVVKKIISNKYFSFLNNSDFQNAFHGTSLDSIFSILKYGLKKPGEIVNGKKIDVVPGHIPLGVDYQGNKNWSRAVFVSPSVYYAAHPVYSKEFIENSDNTAWLPLVQVKVKKGSYTRHDHTVGYYDSKVDEPTCLQFRVKCPEKQDNLIMRSENSENVVVIAAIFIRKGFLDDNDNYVKVTALILDSQEEKMFRKLNG